MEYPKINTLWKRDPGTHCIIPGEYSDPAFGVINRWHITEKVDGTNVRVIHDPDNAFFGPLLIRGKTDNAQLHPSLLVKLEELFPLEKMKEAFKETSVILFGEGYGAKIQKGGGRYISGGVDFILFDVYIDGWWLKPEDVTAIGRSLGVRVVPEIGVLPTDQAIAHVRDNQLSLIAEDNTLPMEGIVARSEPQLFDRLGHRVMWKLKAKDYEQLK